MLKWISHLNKMKRGQITVEFILLVAAVVFLVTIMIASANFNTVLAREKNEQEALSDFADSIQQELVIASEMYPEYNRTFKLANKIVGRDYEIIITDYKMVINTKRGDEIKFSTIRGIPYIFEACQDELLIGENNVIWNNGTNIILNWPCN